MSETKRITLQEALAAYEKTGFGLTKGRYFIKKTNCACAQGAFAVANLGVSPATAKRDFDVIKVFLDSGFSAAYLEGFALGFDGRKATHDDPDYLLGYSDGQSVWDAVKHRAKPSARRGVTLPEILVVVFVLFILFAAFPMIFGHITDKRRIDTASSTIAAYARTAADTAYASGSAGIRVTQSHVAPLVQSGDYSEGLINVRVVPDYSPEMIQWGIDNGVSLYNRLLVESAVFDGVPKRSPIPANDLPEGVANNPTSWFWNVRLGEKIVIRGKRYTVCGPMAQDNAEKFVNVGPMQIDKTGKHRVTWSPLKRTYGEGTHPYSTEFLLLANGEDDDRDGLIDSGWNGIDDNLNGYVDDDYEWEAERWTASASGGLTNAPYWIVRNPAPDANRKTEFPKNVIVDFARSVVPGGSGMDHVDLLFDRSGNLSVPSPYAIPNIPLNASQVRLVVSDAVDPSIASTLAIDFKTGKTTAEPIEGEKDGEK